MKQLKDKKCRWCKQLFIPAQSLQIVCTPQCALAYAMLKKGKERAKETRAMKKALQDKDRPLWIKKAQTAFNAYIRARDSGLPCISCGIANPVFTVGGIWDAGHYLSRGAYPELRFNEDNCHKQCKKCNGGGGNFSQKARTVSEGYDIGILEKIGAERVASLKAPYKPAKWTIDELKQIESDYKAKLKALKNG